MTLITSRELYKGVVAAAIFALLAGCGGDADLNNDEVTYTPEQRPLGVIAGQGSEFKPGSEVTVAGRLVGTVTDQTVHWTQVSGPKVEVDDWNNPKLQFTAPAVRGVQKLKFKIEALGGNGDPAVDADGKPLTDEVSVTIFDPASQIYYEIEDASIAQLNNVKALSEGDENYINGAKGGAHTADMIPGSSVVYNLNFDADKVGFYTLHVRYAIPTSYGGKMGKITVNGVPFDLDFKATGTWEDYRVGTVKMKQGNNVIKVGGGWNYYRIDDISTVPAAAPEGPESVPAKLVNPNASDSALDLMKLLTDSYGKATLSGQTEYPKRAVDDHFHLIEFNKVVDATGDDAPAIVAFDFMNFSSSRVAHGADARGLSEDMIQAHKDKNVILSALWHWNAPSGLIDTADHPWSKGFYTNATTFDLAAALADPDSEAYQALLDDIDTIAAELKKFDDVDIPILWRPLHEAEGGFFWWGAAGPDAFKKLWHLMYDRMTNVHNLNNLIWVYTATDPISPEWYPGDDVVDIVGFDGYDGKNRENPFKSQYKKLKDRYDGKKLVALTETGTIPDIKNMQNGNAWWSFFITWNSGGGNYGPSNAASADIDDSYAYDGVINLTDLPSSSDVSDASGDEASSGDVGAGDSSVYADFESETSGSSDDWQFQVNWGAAPNSTLSVTDSWSADGSHSLEGSVQLVDGDKDIVLQTYPDGGLALDGVKTIKIMVHTEDVGAGVNAKLFAKDPDYTYQAGDPKEVSSGDVELSIDVSNLTELSGFGVQFLNPINNDSESHYFIDKVELVK